MAKTKKTATPIAERRGLEGPFDHDLSLFALLVRADIDAVTDIFSYELGATRVRKGVTRAELFGGGEFGSTFCPFQYRGHRWMTVISELEQSSGYTAGLARRLSEKLGTRAIFAGSHDTAGTIDYILYDRGKLAEVFHWGDLVRFHTLTPSEFQQVEKNGFSKPPYGYYAASKVRELNVSEYEALLKKKGEKFNQHVDGLIDAFLRDQDAYLTLNWMNESGTEFSPKKTGAEANFARIDIVEVSGNLP